MRYGAWAVALAAVLAAGFVAWRRFAADGLPRPGSEAYREVVSAFYTGVVALDVDTKDRAQASLTRAAEIVPAEPASWANRGLLKIRAGDYDAAAADLEHARSLAPQSAEIERLLGLLASQRGRFDEAIGHLRRVIELDPAHLKARYALMEALERQAGPDSDAEASRQVEELLKLQPKNLAVLLQQARLAAKRGDAEALRAAVARLGRDAETWPPNAREQYRQLQNAQDDPRRASTRVAFLRNVLLPTPSYRQSLDAVDVPVGTIGEPIGHFLRLAPPAPTFAPTDDALSHAIEPIDAPESSRWNISRAAWLTGEGSPAVLLGNGTAVQPVGAGEGPHPTLAFPGGAEARPPSPHGILPLTLDADARTDLALAGAGGLRLYHQEEQGGFTDATAASGLGPEILQADLFGVWAMDFEMDGDLDPVVSPRAGPPAVLRNNGDGTFAVLHPFEGAADLRAFAAVDLDGDGDPDAALLDARGGLRVFTNERAGRFQPRPGPDGLGTLADLAVADLNHDGELDLVAPGTDGAILRVSDRDEGRAWNVAEIVRWPGPAEAPTRLLVADLDNNGATDLIASSETASRIWLGDATGRLQPHDAPKALGVIADAADLTGDGLPDLIGLTTEGRPTRAVARGTKGYHWQVIRPRAAQVAGDGRINPFGVGGEIQVRAGVLVQRQAIAGPAVHFGLGDRPAADVARIVWPNGTVQAEFALKADQALVAQQRLKGSCPFLFAFDGDQVRFVTDFLWRSPLGLRINGQETAGVTQTEDWVKVRGDQLAPVDGAYDLRITADLWETHFFDHMALMVVDHPENTEIFVDERFSPREPPPLKIHATGPARPVTHASDDRGADVTAIIRDRDARYLDTFGRGPYQGITRDHWVEIEIEPGDDPPADRPLWLVAHGWTHPTDSSINVAISQGRHDPPRDLTLETPDAEGNWKPAIANLGFPSGKNKTILIPLDGVFRPGAPRRCRLRTNLEIYWDALAVAEALPETPLETTRLIPAAADLSYRGYSAMRQADASSPELPDYGDLTGAGQRWRDLIGFYTRYGDVRELLTAIDDRYVIANAGDELRMRFPAPPPPRSGWTRDFVMIGDGWNKDGDYNTGFSQTVLPLPAHGQPSYNTPPGTLQDDPVYQRHPEDWRTFHTRYVTPREFQRGLKAPGPAGDTSAEAQP